MVGCLSWFSLLCSSRFVDILGQVLFWLLDFSVPFLPCYAPVSGNRQSFISHDRRERPVCANSLWFLIQHCCPSLEPCCIWESTGHQPHTWCPLMEMGTWGCRHLPEVYFVLGSVAATSPLLPRSPHCVSWHSQKWALCLSFFMLLLDDFSGWNEKYQFYPAIFT